MKISRVCELCDGEAVAYCPADNASLCWTCDAKVHQANFLVARHIRQIICRSCKRFTGDRISGIGFQAFASICPSCSPAEDLDSLSSSSSSTACVSSTQSSSAAAAAAAAGTTTTSGQCGTKTRRRPWRVVDSKAESIFVNWFTRLGLSGDGAADVVRVACDALDVCLDQLTILPFRVSLAASTWFAFRFCEARSLSTWQAVKRLEEISGVPAKLISAAESKLEQLCNAPAKRRRRRHHHHQLPEESWAES